MRPSELPRNDLARLEYTGDGLNPQDVPAVPWPVVSEWVAAAHARQDEVGDVPEPGAIHLATVDDLGAPDVRTVLCRDSAPQGLTFFTSLVSAKAKQLMAHPQVAVTWTWPSIFRALRFRGVVVESDRVTVDRYFAQRPWGARISAHASWQSHPVTEPGALAAREAELAERWPDTGSPDDVPTPEHWGGFLIQPLVVEAWTGRRNRLHDRWRWEARPGGDRTSLEDPANLPPMDAEGSWSHEQLQP